MVARKYVLCQYYFMIRNSNDVNVWTIQKVAAFWAKIVDLDWLNLSPAIWEAIAATGWCRLRML